MMMMILLFMLKREHIKHYKHLTTKHSIKRRCDTTTNVKHAKDRESKKES